MASQLEEQQEKLRRALDEWRFRSHDLLNNLRGDPYGCGSSGVDSGSSSSDPIRVHVEPIENSDISALVDSDNVDIAKFITVLSYDCIEISRLRQHASSNIYRQLLLFGHRSSTQEVLLEGEPQEAFGQSLSLFMELLETTNRMTTVLGNLLQQLNSIYSFQDKSGRPFKSFKTVTLRSAFASLGDGLAMFLVLDEILIQNSHIKGYLSLFARMLNKVKLEVGTFGTSVEDIDLLDQVVHHLERLLDVGLFQRLFLGQSSWNATLQKLRCNRKFVDACTSCIHDGLSEILPRLDTWKELPVDRRKILHHVALFLLSVYISAESPDKKLWKLIMEMLQVVPVIYLEGGKRIILLDVLKGQCPQSLSSWPPLREAARNSDVLKSNYLMRLSDMHLRDWQAIKDALSCWVASFQSTVNPLSEMVSEACLRLYLKQIMQGVLLANRMHHLLLSMLDLHALLEVPIRREKFKSLCHMVISLKVVENTFLKKGLEIIRSLPHIINLIQADVERFILPSKDHLHSEVTKGGQVGKLGFLSSLTLGGRDADVRLTDSLSLVLISLQLLQGGGSCKRQLVLSITLDVVQSIGHLDLDFSRIRKATSKLATIADFQNIVEEVTNCSFLYWRKEMIGNWFSMVYMDVSKYSWLQYLLDAFSDGLQLLKLGHVGKLTLQSYEEEIDNTVRSEIIVPLCRDIETDLRLHVHSTHLKGSVLVNPTKTGVHNLSWYLQMKPLRLPFKFIDIKLHVESYLNCAFYDHTAMSSNNWKIYSEMRQLAELKYGLVLDDIHLAEHSLDHGPDMNGIVQNPHTFLESYSYNINKQSFIEKVSNDQGRKALRVFGVEYVASSIAVHGLRLISIASDSVFEFITQRITTLSELLQDSFARSHLVKEFNFWKSDKGTIDTHPSGQSVEFNIAIGMRPLGEHEVSFLEQLRSVITEMGNALGLMRILLAGGSRHACNISWFISRPRSNMSFMESCHKLGFHDEVITAGRVMDTAIENKYQSNDNTEYFSSLITFFAKELRSSTFLHLKDFFLIIPSLIVNLVDSKVHYKDKPLRRDRESGNHVNADDGFVLGIAYVLKFMGQEKSFDELDWFASTKKSLEEAVLLAESRAPLQHKGSTLAGLKLWSQVSSITTEAQKGIDKLKRYQKEMELIECGLNIARTIMSQTWAETVNM